MCGIAGLWNLSKAMDNREMEAVVQRMTNSLVHRGPDDCGVYIDNEAGVALGHRRLSIIDLSSEGRQPMKSACGRYVIAFNGEIYNFKEIRQKLEDCGSTNGWRGHSDTEVMLAAFSHWGFCEAIKRFVGMFAFALWDRIERVLYLARDRMGEKPLYYGWMGNCFLFGSELKALRAHPAWHGDINLGALALFFRHSYIPAPYSIYKEINKLSPGTYLTLRSSDNGVRQKSEPYWSMEEAAEAGMVNPFLGSEQEAGQHLESLLKTAIRGQMIADVPLGAFLSGGIDSSTVVALMQAQSSRPVRTFTIGFHEPSYNEANYAKSVAKHLGTEHTELYMSPSETLAVIPRLPTIYDEPFADSSQVPTFLLAQLTRRFVTVSLSGDGGDELFAGYIRYLLGQRMWNYIAWIPRPFRSALAKIFNAVPPARWDRLLSGNHWWLPPEIKQVHPGNKLQKLSEVLSARSSEELYRGLVSHWKEPSALVLGSSELPTAITDSHNLTRLHKFMHRMMYLDAVTYLPDDILVKVDRASMGVSLESRIPLLDHRVVEFAWRIPLSMKIRNRQSKWLLRQVLYQYVPKKLVERPKIGFGVPIDAWLRGPLCEWAESLLDEHRLRREGYLNPAPIRQKWSEHKSGKRNWQYYLWDVLMFQSWLEAQSGLS